MSKCKMMWAPLILAALTMGGCEPGPRCIRSHDDVYMQITPIDSNGDTMVMPVSMTVCDEYEAPKPEKKDR